MKKLLPLILLLFSCHYGSEKVTDLEKSSLKGKIHKVTFKQFYAEIEDGKIIKREIKKGEDTGFVTLTIEEYNRKGMKVNRVEYVDHNLTEIIDYEYNNSGKLESKKLYSENRNNLFLKLEYKYLFDSLPNRRFILEIPVGNKNVGEKKLQEIDAKGKVICKINNPYDNYFQKKTLYKYNKNGKIKEVSKYGYGNKLYMKELYHYNEKGNIELFELFDSVGELIDYEILGEIKYDINENPIYVVTKDSLKPQMIYEFEYEYY